MGYMDPDTTTHQHNKEALCTINLIKDNRCGKEKRANLRMGVRIGNISSVRRLHHLPYPKRR